MEQDRECPVQPPPGYRTASAARPCAASRPWMRSARCVIQDPRSAWPLAFERRPAEIYTCGITTLARDISKGNTPEGVRIAAGAHQMSFIGAVVDAAFQTLLSKRSLTIRTPHTGSFVFSPTCIVLEQAIPPLRGFGQSVHALTGRLVELCFGRIQQWALRWNLRRSHVRCAYRASERRGVLGDHRSALDARMGGLRMAGGTAGRRPLRFPGASDGSAFGPRRPCSDAATALLGAARWATGLPIRSRYHQRI
jgi:hypothetical protein